MSLWTEKITGGTNPAHNCHALFAHVTLDGDSSYEKHFATQPVHAQGCVYAHHSTKHLWVMFSVLPSLIWTLKVWVLRGAVNKKVTAGSYNGLCCSVAAYILQSWLIAVQLHLSISFSCIDLRVQIGLPALNLIHQAVRSSRANHYQVQYPWMEQSSGHLLCFYKVLFYL